MAPIRRRWRHSQGRTPEDVCALVARALRVNGASWAERHMATVAAAMHGRYPEMMQAMKTEGLEPIVVEDLVRIGEDRGYERGLRELVSAILEGLAERGVVLDEARRARIDGETDPEQLRAWLRALIAGRPIEL